MVATVYSMGIFGMDAFPVEVETDLSSGLPAFDVVGLPDASVKESRDRVRAALKNCGFSFPVSRITMNLAPADKRKEGPIYDLPLLISLLKASRQLTCDTSDCVFLGELSLSGDVRPIRGVLPMAAKAWEMGYKKLFVPAANACEGAAIEGLCVYPISHIRELLDHLTKGTPLTPAKPTLIPDVPGLSLDYADVKGQAFAKRALEIAASGGHNILLIGPPGTGKSMLAKRVPSILPDMTFEESIEITKLHSIAGLLPTGGSLLRVRPFRAPHHTISSAGLSGGGAIPRPGEVSLAHNGVLFLDELPEFSRSAMEVLRQPMEDSTVTISRAGGSATYPCNIMLVAAMNPCPCGYFDHPSRPCTCSPRTVDRYLSKISGPLLDRIDLHIDVPPVDFDELSTEVKSESSEAIRKRVNTAREIQHLRFKGMGFSCNANIPAAQLRELCLPQPEADAVIKKAFEHFGFSPRVYDRILKVARTIADLSGSQTVQRNHAAEAIQYRMLERKYWQREK